MKRKISYVVGFLSTYIKFTVKKVLGLTNINYCFMNKVAGSATVKTSGKGEIFLGKLVTVCANAEIAANDGVIRLEGKNYLNRNTMIVSHERFEIGEGTNIWPNVLIYDHDHNMSREDGNEQSVFVTKPVSIGKRVWIGAGCIILKGVTIGDDAVIAAGSLITKDVAENAVIYQKRVDYVRNRN